MLRQTCNETYLYFSVVNWCFRPGIQPLKNSVLIVATDWVKRKKLLLLRLVLKIVLNLNRAALLAQCRWLWAYLSVHCDEFRGRTHAYIARTEENADESGLRCTEAEPGREEAGSSPRYQASDWSMMKEIWTFNDFWICQKWLNRKQHLTLTRLSLLDSRSC